MSSDERASQQRSDDDLLPSNRQEEQNDEEYTIAPPAGKSREEIYVSLTKRDFSLESLSPPAPEGQPPTLRFQFTVVHLLAIMTFASVGLAGARWLPWNILTFFIFSVLLLGLFALFQSDLEDGFTRLVLLGILTIVVAAMVAVKLI